MTKLSDEEVKDMLAKLSEHFHQPVLPVREVCQAVYTWIECIIDLNRRELDPGDYLRPQGRDYHDKLRHIKTDIMKSALMFRLLYLREPVRTEMCPVHLGHLDMNGWLGVAKDPCGCGGTGWLPIAKADENA